jgi:hypothetical protein
MNKIIITETQLKRLMTEGINVWHGSDRKFDEFDMSMVGSGDGKSLGGWGIYFSTDEIVSKRYFTTGGFVREHEISDGAYFDFDAPASEDGDRILNGLERLEIDPDEIEELRTDYIEQSQNYGDVVNKQVYEWLSYVFNGEKGASLFLKSLGYIGNTFMDKWDTEARNYVVFDTDTILQ